MQAVQTFAINFIIRRHKSNKAKADIYARITVDGQRKEISTKEQIDIKDWDTARECVKGKTMEVKKINEHIDSIRFRIRQKYRILDDEGSLITAETVRGAYLKVQAELKGHKLIELLDYYKKIWEPKLKKGGFKNYKTTIEYIKLFAAFRFPSADTHLSQLDNQFATELEHYIRTTPIKEHDPCNGNGVGKHIQRFKRILNWAVELKWIKNNPCGEYSCPLKKSKRKKLSIQELVVLEQKQLVSPMLCYVKDLFLYSCYTGLAFVDAMALCHSHFETETDGTIWCKIYRTKSDELSAVPLMKSAANIIEKYSEEGEGWANKPIFKSITNQCVNEKLKIIQEICGIQTPLTFHVARHTFAKTVALKNGVPLETVQMMMGHTKISTTQIYADVDEEKIMNDMRGIEDKMLAKRNYLSKKSTYDTTVG
ncbi:site-specific integrase [Foetidibacter luteolus]|uniref:site-specific integrase n=1 Tax=Foetidibacter luteolus TaxID=2608880 RepID=UPI00129BD4D1|nr:site-specific integrase [Foetidibacter luteolus]